MLADSVPVGDVVGEDERIGRAELDVRFPERIVVGQLLNGLAGCPAVVIAARMADMVPGVGAAAQMWTLRRPTALRRPEPG